MFYGAAYIFLIAQIGLLLVYNHIFTVSGAGRRLLILLQYWSFTCSLPRSLTAKCLRGKRTNEGFHYFLTTYNHTEISTCRSYVIPGCLTFFNNEEAHKQIGLKLFR